MKPASIILDLLRTYPKQGMPVQALMDAGNLFGFSHNLMRVSLSRLAAKNILENYQRGYYRLTKATDPVNQFVEQWRQGESRLRAWSNKTWLCVYLNTIASSKAQWALSNLGFRGVEEQFWIRPDNLNMPAQKLHHQLTSLGLHKDAHLISQARLSRNLFEAWFACFDIDRINQAYVEIQDALSNSIKQLKSLTLAEAKRTSFHLGGAAIQMLAKDPLLPYEVQNPKQRILLWEKMLTYDQVGREIWAQGAKTKPDSIPVLRLAS